MSVTAIIVSRMDANLGEVLWAIQKHCDEIIIVKGEGGVMERWEAARRAKYPVIYTQDDDAIVDVGGVLAAYDRAAITCNMPADRRGEYQDGIALVGWGCTYSRDAALPLRALLRYTEKWPCDWRARREADRIVTGLSEVRLIDIPFTHLPIAHHKCRMGRQIEHGDSLREIRRRIYAVRGVETK